MTGKETLDIIEEIQQLKRALGIEAPKLIKVPKDAGRCEPGTKGRCVVCDKEYEAAETVRRCCRDRIVTVKGERKTIVTGYRVCFRCSPWIRDWQLDRYAENITAWPEYWKGKDANAFGSKSVNPEPGSRLEELEQYYEDDEMAHLDLKIKLLEGRLSGK